VPLLLLLLLLPQNACMAKTTQQHLSRVIMVDKYYLATRK